MGVSESVWGSAVSEDENECLEIYTNNMIQIFIEEQVQYFPDSQRVIYFWMITASEILRSVIVEDKLPISYMTSVQMSPLMASIEEDMLEYRRVINSNVIDTAIW